MQTSPGQIQEQQKAKKVQQKIKLMMKYKKMQKLTSQKDLASQKPMSTFDDKESSKFDEISIRNKKKALLQNKYREQQGVETYSNKCIRNTHENEDIGASSSVNLNEQSKKFLLSHKESKGLSEINTMKRIPSAQKIVSKQQLNRESTKKLKRPSSVINKSTRATTSRTRRQRIVQPESQKEMEEKIRKIIPDCFQYGIKLQKYADEKGVDLSKEHQLFFKEELNVIRLINNSKKHYIWREENEEEQDSKLSVGVEKEIIEILKKKREKEIAVKKCELISDQITKLIDARLTTLNKTKITSL